MRGFIEGDSARLGCCVGGESKLMILWFLLGMTPYKLGYHQDKKFRRRKSILSGIFKQS